MNHSYDSIMTFIYYYSKPPRLRRPFPGEALFPLPCKITNNSKSLGTPNPDSHLSPPARRGPSSGTPPPEAGFASAPARLWPRSAARPARRVTIGWSDTSAQPWSTGAVHWGTRHTLLFVIATPSGRSPLLFQALSIFYFSYPAYDQALGSIPKANLGFFHS